MDPYYDVSKDAILWQVLEDVIDASNALWENRLEKDELPTAADIARQRGYRLESVKKKLRILREHDVVQAVTMNPKRYSIDQYGLREMAGDNPFYVFFLGENPIYDLV